MTLRHVVPVHLFRLPASKVGGPFAEREYESTCSPAPGTLLARARGDICSGGRRPVVLRFFFLATPPLIPKVRIRATDHPPPFPASAYTTGNRKRRSIETSSFPRVSPRSSYCNTLKCLPARIFTPLLRYHPGLAPTVCQTCLPATRQPS